MIMLQHTTNTGVQTPAANERVYLTEREMAEQLRISMATIRRLRKQGKTPPAIRIGSQIRYELRACDAWAEGSAR